MRYAVISDVHANATALDAVLADAKRQGAQSIVCLGDVVGYGPEPAKCISRLRRARALVVAGNNDDAVSRRMDDRDFIDLAADAASRHRDALSQSDIAWLRKLPYCIQIEGGALAVHGDVVDPPRFRYVESEADAAENFNATAAQIIFVGHTHVPRLFLTGHSGKVYSLPPQNFAVEDGKRYLVNVGTVGYPRETDGTCLSSYVIYDSDAGSVEYRFLPFAVSGVMQRGRMKTPKAPVLVFALAVGALAAAICAAVALHNAGDAPGEELSRSVETSARAGALAIPFAEKHLELKRADGKNAKKHVVAANLVLDKTSEPVLLKVEYIDRDGIRRTFTSKNVAKSNKGKISLPANAVEAIFSVYPTAQRKEVRISSFSPKEL